MNIERGTVAVIEVLETHSDRCRLRIVRVSPKGADVELTLYKDDTVQLTMPTVQLKARRTRAKPAG